MAEIDSRDKCLAGLSFAEHIGGGRQRLDYLRFIGFASPLWDLIVAGMLVVAMSEDPVWVRFSGF